MHLNLLNLKKGLPGVLSIPDFNVNMKQVIKKLDRIISRWKREQSNSRDAYMKLYGSLTSHDKHIAERYNRMTGSWYLHIIAAQLADKIITVEELSDFPESIRQRIYLLSGVDNGQ